MSFLQHQSSFRDLDSSIYIKNNEPYRIIFKSYEEHYAELEKSGLMEQLISELKLIPHTVCNSEIQNIAPQNEIYKVIKPEIIPTISYSYEWSFSQLKEAALLTLDIQLQALKNDLTLKDASSYNIQFLYGKPIFIDTASFEKYQADSPWVAYKQFCQHFVAPLLFYKYDNAELIKLMWSNIDGIPLTVASKALPYKTKFNFFTWTHIHYHSKLELKHHSNQAFKAKKIKLSKAKLLGFLEFLKTGIENITLKNNQTVWSNYYDTFSYSEKSFNHKKDLVENHLKKINANTVLDLGCNDGEFSLIASKQAKQVIAVDFDYKVVENLYQQIKKTNTKNILPLLFDISNPSPAIGWANTERMNFFNRVKCDTLLALAVIHHIAIGNNVPFSKIASLLATMTTNLIIEFVPKQDVQTQKLLITKKDIFSKYTIEEFTYQFEKYFTINSSEKLIESDRVLFFMTKHEKSTI